MKVTRNHEIEKSDNFFVAADIFWMRKKRQLNQPTNYRINGKVSVYFIKEIIELKRVFVSKSILILKTIIQDFILWLIKRQKSRRYQNSHLDVSESFVEI